MQGIFPPLIGTVEEQGFNLLYRSTAATVEKNTFHYYYFTTSFHYNQPYANLAFFLMMIACSCHLVNYNSLFLGLTYCLSIFLRSITITNTFKNDLTQLSGILDLWRVAGDTVGANVQYFFLLK